MLKVKNNYRTKNVNWEKNEGGEIPSGQIRKQTHKWQFPRA